MSLRRPPSWTAEPPLLIPLDDEALRANDHGHFAGPEIWLLAHGSCRGSLARPTVNEPLDGPSTCTYAVGPACELEEFAVCRRLLLPVCRLDSPICLDFAKFTGRTNYKAKFDRHGSPESELMKNCSTN